MAEVARRLELNRSTVKRYVDQHGADTFGKIGEGRATRINLAKFRHHYETNLRTNVVEDPAPDAPSEDPEPQGEDTPSAQEDTGTGLKVDPNSINEIKRRREMVRLEREELNMARERGELVPAAEFEGLAEEVGATLREKLAEGLPRLILDIRAADSDREANTIMRGHVEKVLTKISQIFEANAVGRDQPN